jgi:hypothetical protein
MIRTVAFDTCNEVADVLQSEKLLVGELDLESLLDNDN